MHPESGIFLLKYSNCFLAFIVILFDNLVHTYSMFESHLPLIRIPCSSLVPPTTIFSQLHVNFFFVHKVPVLEAELTARGGLWGREAQCSLRMWLLRGYTRSNIKPDTQHTLATLSALSGFFFKNEQIDFIQVFCSNYSLANFYKYLQLSLRSTT